MSKVKIRNPGNRSRGGRKPSDGERYPSGKLKPAQPNPEVLARRALLCADPSMATCPLDASYANNWLSRADYGAAKAYISVHAGAGLGSPGASRSADTSLPTGAAMDLSERWSGMSESDIRKFRMSQLPGKELVLIWDSALRDLGRQADPEQAQKFAEQANRRWRALNAAMTSHERLIVDSFCIRETWPRWFHERLAGEMKSHWEDERRILISGLRAIARALAPSKTIARSDLVLPDPPKPRGPVVIERTEIVDDAGVVVQVFERIKRQ